MLYVCGALLACLSLSADEREKPKGLEFRVGAADPKTAKDDAAPRPANADAAALDDADTRRVLDRLPKLDDESARRAPFAFRKRSKPAPRTGKTIDAPFPPPSDRDAPNKPPVGPLEVVRFSPEGDIDLAPHLSITFSQPMVAIDTHASLAAQIPVRLEPTPNGAWRWVGTRTLLFEPRGETVPHGSPARTRFPMATTYRVSVPAGTRSATGGTLAQAATWTFTTPTPRVTTVLPSGDAVARDPLMLLVFDQRIDAKAILEFTAVRASGRRLPVRMATADEIAADERIARITGDQEDDRWVAFRLRKKLPAQTRVTIELEAGAPSAEGPRTTAKAWTHEFTTHGPFVVTAHYCGWNRNSKNCPPNAPFHVEFSNPVDTETLNESLFRFDPEVPALSAAAWGQRLQLRAAVSGSTKYRVTIDGSLRDRFDQTLGKDVTLTFRVGEARPILQSTAGAVTVLDPWGPPGLSVFSTNHERLRLRAYSVSPDDFPAYRTYRYEVNRYNAKDRPAPGREVLDTLVATNGKRDELTETRLDLSDAIKSGGRHLVIVVDPEKQPDPRRRQRIITWAQHTDIALDAFADHEGLWVWANALEDGSTLEGVEVSVVPQGLKGRTDSKGVVRFALEGTENRASGIILARRGDDLALLPESTYGRVRSGSWWKTKLHDRLRWFIFDDRKMYKPGEKVHVKGWIRRTTPGTKGDVEGLGDAVLNVAYTVTGPRRNELAKGQLELNALGGFDFSFDLPDDVNLGSGRISFKAIGTRSLSGDSRTHYFKIQEFRRPEFEVSAQASDGPHLVGGHAEVSVRASYYAGGALPGAPVQWSVTSTPGSYTPPNRSGFVFGTWQPWFRWGHGGRRSGPGVTRKTYSGSTDASGVHRLRVDFDAVDPPLPMSVSAQASVSDVNRQAWAASANLLVHPASLYVGLRGERYFVEKGQPLPIESIVTDIDGKAAPDTKVSIECVRVDWRQRKGEWIEEETVIHKREIVSTADPIETLFPGLEGGTYRIRATIADAQGRRNRSELTRWVAGGKRPKARRVEQEKVTLIPDREEYRAGDVAKVLVEAPFAPAEGVVTLRRTGVVETRRVRLEKGTHTVEVKIEEGHVPNLQVQVDLVGAATRTEDDGVENERLPKRPAYASGSIRLSVPPHARKLAVAAKPRQKAIEPGGETFVDVQVRDADGKPLADAEVAVVVVDEAILALTSFSLADPLKVFYTDRSSGVRDLHLRRYVQLAKAEERFAQAPPAAGLDAEDGAVAETASALGARGAVPARARRAKGEAKKLGASRGSGAAAPQPIDLRENFDALAVFAPATPTDADGYARVKIELPDSLTRYRVIAYAVAGGKQCGAGESSLTVRLPLMVRPSAPRFLNFGDRFELPVVLQNQTEEPMTVDVALRTANLRVLEGSGRRVTVPASDRVEVRFPATTELAGTARVQIGAASGRWADAAAVTIPVWTPATTEAFATYGEIGGTPGAPDDLTVVQPIAPPADVVKEYGGLEITTSSTALHALTDAVIYILDYPYGCAEQVSSRVLTVAALRDVLQAFEADGLPEPEVLIAAVGRDIEKLGRLQRDDGGFGFWRRTGKSWPYIGVHVAHALTRARQKGFRVPDPMFERSAKYVAEIDKHFPDDYPESCKWSIRAYALYVRKLMAGDSGTPLAALVEARNMVDRIGPKKLALEASGWLLATLTGDAGSTKQRAKILRHVGQRVSETASTAEFATAYSDGTHLLLHSRRRTDAVLLDALIAAKPQSDLIPKVVRGLLAHRKQGRWRNTQENAFVLLALDRYFAVYEKETPYFVARAWLGDGYVGDQSFRGRTTDRHHVSIPMATLTSAKGAQDLILEKEGKGRLYYRLGLKYAPTDLQLKAADHGFTVERSYEAIGDPDDVRRDDDGTWHIRLGAEVRVRLTMVAPTRRYHVALVDPLPAGLEALNPALAVTGEIPPEKKEVRGGRGRGRSSRRYRGWWWRTWYEHQNLRDERCEAFASYLWAGVHEYSYVARATTPGVFVVPPTKAEEMYAPETFGRSASGKVVVK